MWWIAKRRKCRDATRRVVDNFQLAFAPYLPDGRLACAMHADPYVLGYVVARLHGLAQRACAGNGVLDEMARVVDGAGRIVFGASYGALRDTMLCAALLPEDGAYGEGLRDGRAQGGAGGDAASECAAVPDETTEAAALARVRRIGFRPHGAESAAFGRHFAPRHPG